MVTQARNERSYNKDPTFTSRVSSSRPTATLTTPKYLSYRSAKRFRPPSNVMPVQLVGGLVGRKRPYQVRVKN